MTDLPALADAQLDGSVVRATALADFDFASGKQRLWGGAGKIEVDGETYDGVRKLGTLSPVSSGPDGDVEEVTATLFGDEEMLGHIAEDFEELAGRELVIRLLFFRIRSKTDDYATDWQIIEDPLTVFLGRMSPATVRRFPPSGDGRPTRAVSTSAQNYLVNRGRPAFQYWSDRDQKARSSDDNLCVRVSQFSEGVVT